ncbi:50S ribosomal protein L17 [Candidatus Saccharibacteria bacterium]|nr:50S ribosomal protein L17 [Candidatus Saccharibacteria bacterium]
MHRHGYKGRKFNRETDQRTALIKGLANSLVLNGSIETTLPKAKEVGPYVEKLITKAKVGDLHNRRQVIAGLQTLEAAHKLVDDIAPKLNARTSGYLRIEKTDARKGDNAQMAKISFVDDLSNKTLEKKTDVKVAEKTEKVAEKTVKTAKKPVAKKEAK